LLADQFTTATARARTLAQLEDLSRLLWRANMEGHVDDGRAGAIAEAVEARRARIKAGRPQPLPSASTGRRKPPSSPDRARSIARRRSQAASGAMPPALAAAFTVGEQSALAVIARQPGRCDLYIDVIAAMAGVCRSIVQSAVREAARLGIIKVTERRIPGRKSLSNLVEIIDQGWLAWRSIGFKKTNATITDLKTRTENAVRPIAKKDIGAPTAPIHCPHWRSAPRPIPQTTAAAETRSPSRG
jgi:hypothetical protein